MRFAYLLVLGLAVPAAGADDYQRLLDEALKVQLAARPDEEPDVRYNRAYDLLARAAELAPERWEAFLRRGLNRCEVAVVNYATLRDTLAARRVRGATHAELDSLRDAGLAFIERCVADAAHDFAVMQANMRRLGQADADLDRFAQAMLLYARRRFLKGERGSPGAIELLKELGRSGYRRALCSEYIARSLNELGVDEFEKKNYAEAQAYWDDALKWAVDPRYTRMILTNKAGGYEMDEEFGAAERVLRRLIDLEPNRPAHWKNLGLVLGFQSRLREALYCYARARFLCGPVGSEESIARWHGNAWMRAAVIHGSLLERDGDLRLAWRLLMEYRSMFGDDYNFSLWFGDFCSNLGQYDLAWTFLSRARDLQPQCTVAYQSLLVIAPRTPGTRDEVRARIAAAERALDAARAQYNVREENPEVKRICGGLQDLADGMALPLTAERIDPDPIAGFTADRPPPWVERGAAQREPFHPWNPADGPERPEGGAAPADTAPAHDTAEPAPQGRGGWLYAGALALLASLAAWLFFGRFRRSRRA